MAVKKRILTITDCTDVAANELHATLVATLDKLNANDVCIEPVVKVEQFSILHGSFCSRLLADSYTPEGLTILAIVNPLDAAHSKRARIAGRLTNGIQFVGANTGIFSWLIKDFGLDEIVETDSTGLNGDKFVPFGGKYIHAPIAAKLAANANLNTIKAKVFKKSDLVQIHYQQGAVLHIDNFGVAKIYFKANEFDGNNGDQYLVYLDNRKIGQATFCYSMKELRDGTLAIYPGSSLELLELGTVRQTDTAEKLGLKIGNVVSFRRV